MPEEEVVDEEQDEDEEKVVEVVVVTMVDVRVVVVVVAPQVAVTVVASKGSSRGSNFTKNVPGETLLSSLGATLLRPSRESVSAPGISRVSLEASIARMLDSLLSISLLGLANRSGGIAAPSSPSCLPKGRKIRSSSNELGTEPPLRWDPLFTGASSKPKGRLAMFSISCGLMSLMGWMLRTIRSRSSEVPCPPDPGAAAVT
ncbi:hypothetical protein E2C01_055092 [Portunus trituberculatus]|uniref:Uncharacterized protein n=1 Tax=Portunus trituberculatus TaxID=210409 RepID=A0A5B7GLE9_PORTR|nr:hypothetical protein [Portunus trituberculatus]